MKNMFEAQKNLNNIRKMFEQKIEDKIQKSFSLVEGQNISPKYYSIKKPKTNDQDESIKR